ncbi:hypothetical protein NKH35_31265, partial [Mesorhizobium sp. M1143]
QTETERAGPCAIQEPAIKPTNSMNRPTLWGQFMMGRDECDDAASYRLARQIARAPVANRNRAVTNADAIG